MRPDLQNSVTSSSQPRTDKSQPTGNTLFLLDAAGAFLSALLLAGVLPRWEAVVGIPRTTLYFLAIFPLCFAIYDIYAYRLPTPRKQAAYLRGIAVMNLLYCGLSAVTGLYHLATITALGWSYLGLEITVVIGLAVVELNVAGRLSRTRHGQPPIANSQ